MNESAAHPGWDTTSLTLPTPSTLYHLAPEGVGTPLVESFTSYLTRLAAAHCVSTGLLLRQVILPGFGQTYLTGAGNHPNLSAVWQAAPALNGGDNWAAAWVERVGELTRRPDLHATTCLPWAAVLPSRGLIRRARAWCPHCYADQQAQGAVIYDPLLWSLQAHTHCPLHWRPLVHTCPALNCRRALPLLHAYAYPGHCSRCGAWLGQPAPSSAAETEAVPLALEELAGALLAGSTAATPPRREPYQQALMALLHAHATEWLFLAHLVGVDRSAIRHWATGTDLPQLGNLVRLCRALDVDIVQLVRGNAARRIVDAPERQRAPTPARTGTYRAFDHATIEQQLAAVLAQETGAPSSMRTVAAGLGYHQSQLYRAFPDLCQAISVRYQAAHVAGRDARTAAICAAVRQAVADLHRAGFYPSKGRTAQALPHPAWMREPAAQDAWRTALAECGFEDLPHAPTRLQANQPTTISGAEQE